jgi:outer membrane lipoprotein carrier protein
MKPVMRFIAVSIVFGAQSVSAQSTTAQSTQLDRYLDGLSTLNTSFVQVVTDAHAKQVESGSGSLLVQRPGKFRWDYLPVKAGEAAQASQKHDGQPDAQLDGQLLVADGKNLWFYDRELAQVSVKPVEAALSATPIMLLSGSSSALHAAFEISDTGSHDGMTWVRVKPRGGEADFSEAQLGFAHDQLTRMLVNDRLGQTVRLDFSHTERNAHLDAAQLQFKPPAGVDVIGTPQS